MAKYLDPKADLTFKRIFGEHPHLVMSLLNALLPLPKGQEIKDIEYMSPERVPRTSIGKNSIVDVFCKTKDGRQFIVEMQMYWSTNFKDRVLFNSAKVYVDQLEHAEDFTDLRPVYSLNLVNENFEKDIPEFIHYYRMVHEKYTEKVIDGFHLVFVELKKFQPQSIAERKMAVLWLRFLTEINKNTEEVPQELLENDEIREAIELVQESAYTREQLMGYDLFWDAVRVDREKATEAERRYKAGLKEGIEETARRMKSKGYAVEDIAEITGMTAEEIEGI
ncbi:MAG: Rpn family recombination-promoting nuclease/putative transposase [Prevotella sp.]|nr:Rpn family recombination-promoting nuclease/putative transposase [Prevotella sp.]